ncbi:MAG TPA: RluA family pseudouridine synthase [Tepidisphaeraceae bacterium]|jgi:23S rRNA pseudouridine1911/1915/1917 synthase|nr:RluA family pseudouridine synthase [Tepidisphaeraceae bacterium]
MPTLLDRLLLLQPTAKRTTLRQMLAAGRVRVDGQRARSLKQELPDSAKVTIADHAPRATPSPGPLTIVHEDADLLVINKPPGLLTSTGPREQRPTALKFVQDYFAGNRDVRVGLIHRLDRDASGLLVFSKSNMAYDSLKTQFFKHSVDRVYSAVVMRVPSERQDTLNKPLEERTDGTVYVCRGNRGQLAVTHYAVVSQNAQNQALLRVTLETGRKHQIRVHLSHAGWPIVGDSVYGDATPGVGLMLCAVELAVDHPRTGQRVAWSLPIPAFMRKLFAEPKP